ncbi:antitermination protein [Pantoea stewartii]|uniref:Antitermination protein n=1 Tax=Pantoea stewartii subsp. stewartii DC283 TaxID=660596 RepID=H3RBJ1_PANSE|nr:antitermination protein [Pantoea stewartii]ARF49636.1 antitermination protein [Pantoea stewartii subsp. stewartii DC283]EHU01330.1 putative chaparone [Pantoea stewartii subsp. stewartii DC283]KAB0559999.1 antitermination protein [Pantoea stewartii subsp. stewartii]
MKLESALKYFNPKSQQYDATTPATGSDSLTGTDLMGAVGFCQSKAPFGISAVLAKSTGSNEETYRTVEQLLQYANRTAPKLLRKAAGAKLGRCLMVLSKLAFDEYARSASSTAPCQHCNGTGFNHVMRSVVKYPGYISAVDGEEKIPPRIVDEMVREKCTRCDGKGRVYARCRCNGTGRVRDLEASKRQGVPVDKECERCSSRGYRRLPSSMAYRSVALLVPDLTQSSWSRNWKPFFEMLVSKCEIEEAHADAVFMKATK